MSDWGTPDWRDAAAYPKISDLSDDLWRWQFIRRMPDYREAWDRAAPLEYQIQCDRALKRGRDVSGVLLPNDAKFVVDSAVWLNLEDDWEGLFYGILPYPNPRTENPNVPAVTLPTGGAYPTRPIEEFREELIQVPAGWSVVNFNLAEPLDSQVRRAHRELAALQRLFATRTGIAVNLKAKQTARARRSQWPTYLRVMDARDAGATFHEIGCVLAGIDAQLPDEATSRQVDKILRRQEAARSGAKARYDAALSVANKRPR